ncbi:MAG: septum formation initiator family protein [Rhizobiales bacterium]|nr:septum formation initiator family protein [Hyphomicrobiales bacterium]NRB15548.1 septum formation initiator family protein [Hyphomicrobiales bacterium]
MLLYRIKKLIRSGFIVTLLTSLCFYFGFHLFDGEKGLISMWRLQDNQIELHSELVRLQGVKTNMQALLSKLDSGAVEDDFLDELVRQKLGYVAKNDLIILRPKASFN